MKTNKETFRSFDKNLLVYMSPAGDVPQMDYVDFKKEGAENIESDYMKAKRKDAGEFTESAEEIIEKLNLDGKDGDTETEKERKEEIRGRVGHQFQLLEHNYQVRLDELGRQEGNEEAKEAKKTLDAAVEKFLFQLELNIVKINITSKEGADEARCALIDEAVGNKKGFGKYFLESNSDFDFSPLFNAKNQKEFDAILRNMLDDQSKLKETVFRMRAEGPQFERDMENPGDKNRFAKLITKSNKKGKDPEESLTYIVGKDKADALATLLANRFDYVRDRENGNHYVDLLEGNTIIQEGSDFDEYILGVCHNEFTKKGDIQKQTDKIAGEKAKYEELISELTRNHIGGDELDGIDDIKENKSLDKLIAMHDSYRGEASEEKAELDSDAQEWQLEGIAIADNTEEGLKAKQIAVNNEIAELSKSVDSDLLKKYPTLREGIIGDVMELLKTLFKKGDVEGAKEARKGVERGENPKEKQKDAYDAYLEALNAKKDKEAPTVLALAKAAYSEDVGYFNLEGEGAEAKNEAMKNYPSQKNVAIAKYMTEKTGLNITEIDSKGVMTARIGSNELKFKIPKEASGNLTVYIGENKQEINFSDKINAVNFKGYIEGLSNHIEKQKSEAKYRIALKELVSNNPKGKSILGQVIESVSRFDKKTEGYPTWNKAKGKLEAKDRKDGGKVQTQYDTMRAEFILDNLAAYKPKFRKFEEVQAKIDGNKDTNFDLASFSYDIEESKKA